MEKGLVQKFQWAHTGRLCLGCLNDIICLIWRIHRHSLTTFLNDHLAGMQTWLSNDSWYSFTGRYSCYSLCVIRTALVHWLGRNHRIIKTNYTKLQNLLLIWTPFPTPNTSQVDLVWFLRTLCWVPAGLAWWRKRECRPLPLRFFTLLVSRQSKCSTLLE